MKVMLINGSPHQYGCTYTALKEAADALNLRGVETEILWIGQKPVAGCIACSHCKENGLCVFDDLVNYIISKLPETDGFIFGSPVYYAGPSGQLQSLMDRLFHGSGSKFAGKVASAVVSCRRGGASAAFQRLNLYFQMNNMIVITSQYWNQVHGHTPEQVRQDAEGMQTMRTLAENMAYVLKSLEAGRNAGVPPLSYEPKEFTNFIR